MPALDLDGLRPSVAWSGDRNQIIVQTKLPGVLTLLERG